MRVYVHMVEDDEIDVAITVFRSYEQSMQYASLVGGSITSAWALDEEQGAELVQAAASDDTENDGRKRT